MNRTTGLMGEALAVALTVIAGCTDSGDMGSSPELAAAAAELGMPHVRDTSSRDWPTAAHDPAGTGHNSRERALSPRNVHTLEVKWTFDATTVGAPVAPIHANPVVAEGRTFVGSYGGTFYAIDRDGQLDWAFETEAPGPLFQLFFGDHAPIVGGAVLPDGDDSVVFGDTDGKVYRLDRDSGELLWSRDLSDHDLGGIWGNSLTVHGHTVYVGMASFETLAPFFPGRTCCTHRGGVFALDLETGDTLWHYEAISADEQGPLPPALIAELGTIETFGPSGGDVWNQPTLDVASNTLYVSTGQLFSRAPDGSGPPTHDAVIALDASTGEPLWVTHLSDNVDVFRFDTPFFDPDSGEHFDKDVADQPTVYHLSSGRKVVGVGQKTGEYHVLDAATGELLTSTAHIEMVVGEGGFQSGGATDGELVFQHGTTTASDPQLPFDGVVMALEPDGRSVRWELTLPGSALYGSLAVANDVLYFQSPYEEASADDPPAWALYAVHAPSGEVLARVPFDDARAVNGPAIARGRVYAGFGGAFGFGPATPLDEGGVVCLGLPDD